MTTCVALTPGGVEGDVVGLPAERRLAGVDDGDDLLVDRAAVVVLELEAVGVEDLELVTALEVDAAVTAPLALLVGEIGDVELDVHPEVAELVSEVWMLPLATVATPSTTGHSAGALPSALVQAGDRVADEDLRPLTAA